MSSQNYFDLLGDDENEEPTAVIARAALPPPADVNFTKKSQVVSVPLRLPIKPQSYEAEKEHRYLEGGRGGRGGGRGGRFSRGSYGDRDREGGTREGVFHRENRDGFTRERGGYSSDRGSTASREHNSEGYYGNLTGSCSNGPDGGVVTGVGGHGGSYGGGMIPRLDGGSWSSDSIRGRGTRGGGRGRDRGFVIDLEDRPRRREFDRRSGSGFGNEIKRDGSGRGNWGAEGDQDLHQVIAVVSPEMELEKVGVEREDKIENEINVGGAASAEDGVEKKEADEEDNELTLDEYEKILEEKRKALLASRTEERKVEADKAFESMQLVDKKSDVDVFIKVGSEKEKKKKDKDVFERDDKIKKTQSINDFLKPADGEKYYGSAGGRGRGRGRVRSGEGRTGDGDRGGVLGGRVSFAGGFTNARRLSAPRIEDPGQFPTLGAK